jgi:hypothetical protein
MGDGHTAPLILLSSKGAGPESRSVAGHVHHRRPARSAPTLCRGGGWRWVVAVSQLVKGGHCNRISNGQPFVIGIDFRPPMPAGWFLPRIKPSADALQKLMECLDRAGAVTTVKVDAEMPSDQELFSDAVDGAKLQNGVTEALSFYVGACLFQPQEKKVRDQIKLLKRRVARFTEQLPREHEAVGKFIFETYTGESFLPEHLRPSEPDLIALQEAWRQQFGFSAVRETLKVMERYILAAEACLGKAKPRKHRVLSLVRHLASVWQTLTGKWPRSGRDPWTSAQTGPFADFVRIAAGSLPEDFRIASLDASIRQVVDAPT